MHPALLEFMIKTTESVIPIGTSIVMGHFKLQANKKLMAIQGQNLEKQQRIMNQHNHSNGHQDLYNPNIPRLIDLKETPEEQTLESVKAPFMKVPNIGGMDKIHAEKWNDYWNTLYELPDNASKGDSVKAMKKIQEDIQKYPCLSCRENAKSHLQEMKDEGDLFPQVESKEDAIQKLCRFKNKVNETKGNELFDCEVLANA